MCTYMYTVYILSLTPVLGYGAVITLKNHRGGGGLLHSHSHLYPEDMAEIRQQQVPLVSLLTCQLAPFSSSFLLSS